MLAHLLEFHESLEKIQKISDYIQISVQYIFLKNLYGTCRYPKTFANLPSRRSLPGRQEAASGRSLICSAAA